tara:strand:- start:355 stop:1245 length:891 start_codon:yes stop_codon:yes gene_type:complete
MKIFDCFMYFDEDLVLDLRLNMLDKFVDHFVVVESKFTHRGEKRELKFDLSKFKKFENKIIYLIYDKEPQGIKIINEQDSEPIKSTKYILNAGKRENGQRNYINQGLKNASEKDIVMISDVDEIPDLSNLNFSEITEKIILFKQDMFYYKFNLKIPNFKWTGTKVCRKKNLINPQWLRDVKDRKYPFYRFDTFFSKKKYMDIKFIEKGGWHFSNIKTATEIEHKLKSYLHHREFDLEPLSTEGIKKIMKNKQAIYDLTVDKRVNKIGAGSKLIKFEFERLPEYIKNNKENYKNWLD